ncbi:MAG: class I SAM-dependent methyltransferase [Ilumatobacteraceae bacterium]
MSNGLAWRIYRRFYDRLWDDQLTRAVGAAVVEHVPSATNVLEVGAGTGLCTSALLASGLSVIAAEPDEHMRAALGQRCPTATITADRIDQLDPAQRFDAVVAANVIHLTDDADAALSDLRSRCTPDGRVVVVTPHPGASIWRVCRAKRAVGVSRRQIARFIAFHAAFAPLLAARAAHRPFTADRPPDAVIGGVSSLFVYEASTGGTDIRHLNMEDGIQGDLAELDEQSRGSRGDRARGGVGRGRRSVSDIT